MFDEDHEPIINPPCLRCKEGVHKVASGRKCSYCGSTDKYAVRKRKVRKGVRGKRGRNSGKVSQHGKK